MWNATAKSHHSLFITLVRNPRASASIRGGRSSSLAGRFDQLPDRRFELRLAAELHAERAELVGVDLVARRWRVSRDLALAQRDAAGDRGHVVLGDVEVVAVVRLPRDPFGREQNADGPGDVGRVNFLSPLPAGYRLAAGDGRNQGKPFAPPRRPGQAVNAGGAQSTDWEALPQAVAMHELFQCRLVGSVVARGP